MKTPPVLSVINRHLSAAIQTGTGIKPVTPGVDPPTFTPGQTLRAVVVAATAENRFTLETGGSRFTVQSTVPLSSGQSLDLQVLSIDPEIALQITGDTAGRYFSRSLSSAGTNQDLASFFSLLQQAAPSRLSGLSNSSSQALQQFALLQQHTVPGRQTNSTQQGVAVQTLSPGDYGPKILEQIFSQFEARMDSLPVQGRDQTALTLLKSTIQDIALLFQGKGQLSQTALTQLDQLPPSSRQLFENIVMLQQDSTAGKEAKESAFNRVLQVFQPGPEPPLNAANSPNILHNLKSGLAELGFLFKGPEGLLRLAAGDSLQSGLLTGSQAEAILSAHGGTGGPGIKEGETLQQLVNRLGLNLEGLLAAEKTEEAVKTVKFALLEMVQNFAEQGRLAESGRHSLNTIEFFQLVQLQTIRQDALVLPLPLPFLEQGYLLIEDYKEQAGNDDRDREMARRFSLLLKLTPLGNLRIDFLATGDGVHIRFNSESKEVSDYLAAMKADLDSAITSTAIHGVSFTESGEDPLGTVLKKIRAGADSFIDTNA